MFGKSANIISPQKKTIEMDTHQTISCTATKDFTIFSNKLKRVLLPYIYPREHIQVAIVDYSNTAIHFVMGIVISLHF